MRKKGGVVLVLSYACKAFSEPSAYNQVLFHKTCRLVIFFATPVFFCTICILQTYSITLEKSMTSFGCSSVQFRYENSHCLRCKQHKGVSLFEIKKVVSLKNTTFFQYLKIKILFCCYFIVHI